MPMPAAPISLWWRSGAGDKAWGPQAGRAGDPPARLGTQAAAAFCVQAAASRQPPSPPALPTSQNRGQMSLWLPPSQAVCPAAAAQGREPALSPIPGGCRGSLARRPQLQQRRSPAGAGPGGLSGQVHSRSRGGPGHSPPPGRPSCRRPLPAGNSCLATPKPAGAPSLAEPGLDVAVAAAKPGGLPGGGCTGAGTDPPVPSPVAAEGPCQRPRSLFGEGAGRESGPDGPSGRKGCTPAIPGRLARAQENPQASSACARVAAAPCRPHGLGSGFRSPSWR